MSFYGDPAAAGEAAGRRENRLRAQREVLHKDYRAAKQTEKRTESMASGAKENLRQAEREVIKQRNVVNQANTNAAKARDRVKALVQQIRAVDRDLKG